MLTPEEKERLHELEATRLEIRRELDPPKKPEDPKPEKLASKVWRLLNSQVGMWFLGSVLVAGVTTLWNCAADRRAELREDSEFLAKLLPYLTSPEGDTRSKAINVILARYPNGELPPSIEAFLGTYARVETGRPAGDLTPDVQQTVANTVQRLEQVKSPSDSVLATLNRLPPRVYIQVSDESQLSAAKQLQGELRKSGFSAPGIENVGAAKSPSSPEVRYFNDSDLETAEKLKVTLETQGVQGVTVKKNGLKANTGTLEVWFPKR